MNPAQWGDRVKVELSQDPEGEKLFDFASLTTEQLEAVKAILDAKKAKSSD